MQNYFHSEYLAERVLSASPAELISMLYEGAVSSVQLAIDMYHARDIMGRGKAVSKAIEILGELRASLTIEAHPEFCARMADLYGYMQRRLLEAHAKKSETTLIEILNLLKSLQATWLDVVSKLAGAHNESEFIASISIPGASPYEVSGGSWSAGRSWQV